VNLYFHASVQRDVDGAADYYSDKSASLGDEFWDDLQERLREIRENPNRFGFHVQRLGLRRARLRGFPYIVIYHVSSRGVKITCVKHNKQHPRFGLSRR